MSYQELKERVYHVNMGLVEAGLVLLTWGNASAIDPDRQVMAIKPSGVSYDRLTPEDIVILSLDDGSKLEGELNPSSDTPTHLYLYRRFPSIGGIIHTHSHFATSWAQAGSGIPCYGTTHADTFYGEVPVSRMLTPEEIRENYEENTGKVIAERFADENPSVEQVPAVLVPFHGPFAWGKTPEKALENAIILEEVARMAYHTRAVAPSASPAPQVLLDKHYLRKHGPGAYYGQAESRK